MHGQPAVPEPRPRVHRLPPGHRRLGRRRLVPGPADRRDAEEARPEDPVPPGQRRQGDVLEHPRRARLLHRVPRLPGHERHVQRAGRAVDHRTATSRCASSSSAAPTTSRTDRSNVGPNDSDDGMNWITAAYQTNDPATRHPPEPRSDPRLHEAQLRRARRLHRDRRRQRSRRSRTRGSGTASTSRSSSARTPRANRAARNVLIQNNFLDCCISGYYSIGLGDVERADADPLQLAHARPRLARRHRPQA